MEHAQFVQRLEHLASELESCAEPALQQRMRTLVQTLLELHGRGLGRVMQHISESQAAQSIFDALGGDELVSSLLLLHDLHPWDLKTRVDRALDAAASDWASRGVSVEHVEISPDGLVRLRIANVGEGRRSSPGAVKRSIEQVILAAAPDAAGVSIEGLATPPVGFVPLSGVRIIRAKSRDPAA